MKLIDRLLTFLFGVFALSILPGCGVTGGTSARKVALNPTLASSSLAQSALIGSITARHGAEVTRAIGAYNFGKFSDTDLANLRESVRRSLPAASQSTALVHVMVQHFGLTFTNNRGACLAIIDWCVAENSRVIASERFYTAYDTGDKLLGTESIGMVKNRVLHASTQRIVERSLAAINGLPPPPAPALTFDDSNTASAVLPTHMTAVSAQGTLPAAMQQTMLGGLENSTALLPDPIPQVIVWSKFLTN